jgi:hypothetical protein
MGDITEGTTILEGIQNAAGTQNVIYSVDGETSDDFDKAVVVIGEQPYAEGDGDRDDLTISEDDIDLVKRVYELGKPTIVILLSGRPMIINPILHSSDVIVAAWLPGTEGDGIADLLFGVTQPKGKLGHSWPKYMDQIPINIGDEEYDPLFEYGFGLTSTENSEPGSDPEFYSAIINEVDETIEIALNKSIDASSILECSFTIYVDGAPTQFSQSPTLHEGNSNIIVLELPVAVSKDQKIALSFNSGTVNSVDGGTLQSFSNEFVFNGYNDAIQAFLLPGKIEAEDYHYMSGVQTESTSDDGGGLNVAWIDNGDWLKYLVTFNQSGTYQVNYRIAALSNNGILNLEKEDEFIASSFLPVTLGWQNWETVSTEVQMDAGTYFLTLSAEQGGFNINWFSFDLISNVDEDNLQNEFSLSQNYPNPFNPSTSITYNVPKINGKNEILVSLKVHDILGRIIATLVDERQSPGRHEVDWNAGELASGTYYYQLRAGDNISTKKLMLLK